MKQQFYHIKKRLVFIMLLMPLGAYAQKDNYKMPIPVKNRVVNYMETYTLNKAQSKTQLFDRAVKWVSQSFKGKELGVEKADKTLGQITGKGIFKIVTSDSGNYYWLKFNIDITVTDTSCVLSTLNYYEKPVESGITNDYSKIEYRWGDYKRGKPWSAEDEKLFLGLNSNSLALMASFKKEMSR
jgi:hypothetical protein